MKLTTLLKSTLTLTAMLSLTGCGDNSDPESRIINPLKVSLGKSIYNDTALSQNRTMSCATCHSLDHAMIDPRVTSMTLGASLGDDNTSIGDRNAPTAAYAAFAPDFHFDAGEGLYIGGQFLDGRAADLKAQAKGPFLNPLEMGMADESAVVMRFRESTTNMIKMMTVYGSDIFDDDMAVYDAMADSLAAFEKSNEFSPFDSKYDKLLSLDATLTEQEEEGRLLFNGKAMCSACHPSTTDGSSRPLFTDFSYDNLGVPVNTALRAANGVASIDNGLGKEVNEAALNGAFKVSSLRNIAVTGPYMHNGVFKDLKTVVHFYNTRDTGGINPETGAPWQTGEVDATKNTDELGDLGLSDQEEDAIVAFLKTLTDEKFQHLVD